jgi:hypothetical protein
MTTNAKIKRVQVLLMNDASADDQTVAEYLEMSKETVLATLYPFGIPEGVEEVPSMYEAVQCELAARYFARRGGLGETMHIENGIHRDWYSSDDREVLAKIVPYAKVL